MSAFSVWNNIKNNLKLALGMSATYGGKKNNQLMSYRTLRHYGKEGNVFDIGKSNDETDTIKQVQVPSTCVKSVTYNPKKENLEVNFVNGKHPYDYPATKEEFKDFINSESKGRAVRELRTYY